VSPPASAKPAGQSARWPLAVRVIVAGGALLHFSAAVVQNMEQSALAVGGRKKPEAEQVDDAVVSEIVQEQHS